MVAHIAQSGTLPARVLETPLQANLRHLRELPRGGAPRVRNKSQSARRALVRVRAVPVRPVAELPDASAQSGAEGLLKEVASLTDGLTTQLQQRPIVDISAVQKGLEGLASTFEGVKVAASSAVDTTVRPAYELAAASVQGGLEGVSQTTQQAMASVVASLPPDVQHAVNTLLEGGVRAALLDKPETAAQWGVGLLEGGLLAALLTAGAGALLYRDSVDEALGMDEWAALAAAEGAEEPDELKVYDPAKQLEYFKQRPATLVRRAVRSGVLLGSFSSALWLDGKLKRRPEEDEDLRTRTDTARAAQLRALLIRLGPTYVKLGQVLSSRQDLLPAPYITELRTLQDAVPPFADAAARRALQEQLGPDIAGRLDLSASPLASASLGQVYKGYLRGLDGEEDRQVAVKIQRPGALAAISLDITIIRLFAPTLYKLSDPKGNLDPLGLVDEWGTRFIDELDYKLEVANADEFSAAVAARPDLRRVVMAPQVLPEACARKVLTSEWVDGCRLDESPADDVGQLCAVALASYLFMLLETGTLHVDPHPGNLLRTTEGKLCILDWGLVTTVTEEQSDAILQFIAHLVSKDFQKVDSDLVKMGFVAPEKLAALQDRGLTNAIATLFSALAAGGGAAGFRKEIGLPDEEQIKLLRKKLVKIKDKQERREAFIEAAGGAQSKVAQLTTDLEEVQKKYGNVFTIPAYFGYILRAFSVLEGIGLAQDADYSIANECYPFVARRLLTGRNDGTRMALEQLLYGSGGPEAQLSVKRVRQLSKAFGSYSETVSAAPPQAGAESGEGGGEEGPLLTEGTREALRLALDAEGGPLQDIVLREAARLSGALVADTLESTVGRAFEPPGLLYQQNELIQGLPEPVRAVVSPLPTPYELYDQFLAPYISKSPADVTTLEVAAALRETFAADGASASAHAGEGGAGGPSPETVDQGVDLQRSLRLGREIIELAPELAPGAQAAALRFAALLLEQGASRIAHNRAVGQDSTALQKADAGDGTSVQE